MNAVPARAQNQSAMEQSPVYSTWATEHYESLTQHTAAFEILFHDLKRQTKLEHALSLIASPLAQEFTREEFELLVTTTPDSVVSPLMKRILLGAYFLAPSDRARVASLEYFVKYDTQMNALRRPGLSSAGKKTIYKKISADLLEFQKKLLVYLPDRMLRTRYLKSVARVMVSEDRDVLKWTEKALKQDLGYPRFTWRERLWIRLSDSPTLALLIPMMTAFNFIFIHAAQHSADPSHKMSLVVPILATLDSVFIMGAISEWRRHSKSLFAENPIRPELIQEKNTIELERKAMMDFMQLDCEEIMDPSGA